jgi:hypothetical protein
MNIDVRKFAPKQVESVNAEELTEALEQFKSVGAQVLAAEIKLKELKDQEKYHSEFVIPGIMEKMGLSTLKLKDGSELAVKKVYSAKIKADKKAEAIQWLRDNGLGDIVKNNISVAFGQGEENKAMAYATLAKESGYEPSQSEKVEPQTLRVTMEDWKNKGKEVPQDLFWVFEGNQTKVK